MVAWYQWFFFLLSVLSATTQHIDLTGRAWGYLQGEVSSPFFSFCLLDRKGWLVATTVWPQPNHNHFEVLLFYLFFPEKRKEDKSDGRRFALWPLIKTEDLRAHQSVAAQPFVPSTAVASIGARKIIFAFSLSLSIRRKEKKKNVVYWVSNLTLPYFFKCPGLVAQGT